MDPAASPSIDEGDKKLFDENNRRTALDIPYLNSFPPGFRFCPLDEELIVHYLKNKVTNRPMPKHKIMDVNLYAQKPDKLAEMFKHYGDKEWYFFTPREKRFKNGSRPKRAAGGGYWKATGADKPIKYKNALVGYRKVLVFYDGKGTDQFHKTNWIMHEYRISAAAPRIKTSETDMRLDDWVLCRIYKKEWKGNDTRNRLSNPDDLAVQNNVDSPDALGDYVQSVATPIQQYPVQNNVDSPDALGDYVQSVATPIQQYPELEVADYENCVPGMTEIPTYQNICSPAIDGESLQDLWCFLTDFDDDPIVP